MSKPKKKSSSRDSKGTPSHGESKKRSKKVEEKPLKACSAASFFSASPVVRKDDSKKTDGEAKKATTDRKRKVRWSCVHRAYLSIA